MSPVDRRMRRARSLAVFGLVVGGVMTVTSIGSHADDVTCFGMRATIVGTPEGEFLNGTQGDDVMTGLGGDDTVQGGSGNDALCGDNGNDQLFGESGSDFLDGGDGNDVCNYTNGDEQAEDEERYEGCETAKAPRRSTGEDSGPEPLAPGTPLPYPVGDAGPGHTP